MIAMVKIRGRRPHVVSFNRNTYVRAMRGAALQGTTLEAELNKVVARYADESDALPEGAMVFRTRDGLLRHLRSVLGGE